VEFWQELDATRAGCISLFELDPEAVVLLTKFYWRLLGLVPREQMQDPEQLFNRLTSRSIVKLNRPGQLESHEFRRVMKVLGFTQVQTDRIFNFLDSHGGEGHTPPATVLPTDLAWLHRLPRLVHTEAVMLHDEARMSITESLRTVTEGGRAFVGEHRRTRSPAVALGKGSSNAPSARSSITSTMALSSGGVIARRSVSSSPPPQRRRGSLLSLGLGSNFKPPQTAREDFLNCIKLQLPLSEQAQQEDEVSAAPTPIVEERSDDADASPKASLQDPMSSAPASPAAAAQDASTSRGSRGSGSGSTSSAAQVELRVGDEVVVREAFCSNSAKPMTLRKGLTGTVAEVHLGSGAMSVQFLSISVPQKISAANVSRLMPKSGVGAGAPATDKGPEVARNDRSGAAALVPRINIKGMERKAADANANSTQLQPKKEPPAKVAEPKEPKRVAAKEQKAKMTESGKLDGAASAPPPGGEKASDEVRKNLQAFFSDEEEDTF